MPTDYGGAGLGVTEAALMMHTVGRSAGAFAGLLDHSYQLVWSARDHQVRYTGAKV
jgi:hypothetical protein